MLKSAIIINFSYVGIIFYSNLYVDEEVTGGSIKVAVKYGIIPIYSSTFELCGEVPKVDLTCPLSKGNHTIDLKETIPSEVPDVSYMRRYLHMYSIAK